MTFLSLDDNPRVPAMVPSNACTVAGIQARARRPIVWQAQLRGGKALEIPPGVTREI